MFCNVVDNFDIDNFMKPTKAQRQKKDLKRTWVGICGCKCHCGLIGCGLHEFKSCDHCKPEEQVGCECHCHESCCEGNPQSVHCKMCQPQPADKTGEWNEEFDDTWVDYHAEIVKADPKQLKEWIYNLLSRQREEILRRVKVNSFQRVDTYGIDYIRVETVEKFLQALDKEEEEDGR